MKRIVFVISHIGADAESFALEILNENPRIQLTVSGLLYGHPSDTNYLVNLPHKLDSTAAIYGDVLLHNTNFCCPSLHTCCKFIYLLRDAKPTLNVNTYYPRKTVETYYRYRLRRMYEMARNTPGAVLLTWDDMRSGKGYPLIEEYLDLKEPLPIHPEIFKKITKDVIPIETVNRCQDAYEKYLFKMRSLLRTA